MRRMPPASWSSYMVMVMVLALVLSIGILCGHGHVGGPANRNVTVVESLTYYTAIIRRLVLCACKKMLLAAGNDRSSDVVACAQPEVVN